MDADGPLVAFYGDDFTGATDAMEALSSAGVETVLFLDPPDSDRLDEFPGAQAVGVAGTSRGMTPAEMEEHLPGVFAALGRLGAPLLHYKVCSTFDSSPEIGSIGRAIDLAQETLGSPFVPLVVGVPELGRYVVFANHFAAVDSETYRLDRHPVMSDHPVTPMTEADLRRHLGEQTDRPIGSVDVHDLTGRDAVRAAVEDCMDDGDELVLFDTLTDDHLARIGAYLDGRAAADDADPLVVVGSSGVEYALADRWRDRGLCDGEPSFPALDPADPLVVVSGSASPVTDEQIAWALDNGFAGVRLDTVALVDPDAAGAERDRAVAAAVERLAGGESVVLYTARGPEDDAIAATRERARALGVGREVVGRRIGRRQGEILRDVLRETGLGRTCVAGGDTCGHVTPALGIYALEAIDATATGSPLCRASAREPRFDGLQVALKGGQLGQRDYFGRVREPDAFD